MGTNRLGPLPRSKKWAHVVGLLGAGAGAGQLAGAALDAAGAKLAGAAKDAGLVEAVRVLMLLPVAAGADDFAGALRGRGVDAPDDPGFCDVLGAASEALDAATPGGRGRTDLGEMAQAAAGEALSAVVGAGLRGLFGADPADVRAAFARHATEANFGALARDFFARFAAKCLHYFLSRELPSHVGPGDRFNTVADHAAFTAALDTHCREAAKVVEAFAGEWYGRERHRAGGEFDRDRVRDFTHGAFAKLTGELKRGAR